MAPLFLPALFFAVYGGIGNVAAHVTWAFIHWAHFPGLITRTGHANVGPFLLRTLWPSEGWKDVAEVALTVIVVQGPLLIMTAHTRGLDANSEFIHVPIGIDHHFESLVSRIVRPQRAGPRFARVGNPPPPVCDMHYTSKQEV